MKYNETAYTKKGTFPVLIPALATKLQDNQGENKRKKIIPENERLWIKLYK